MAMFYKQPPVLYDSIQDSLPFMPVPDSVEPVFPEPWIDTVIPPEEEKRPPPSMPPVVVIRPVMLPPFIVPPPPDIMPYTIVPPEYEEPRPPTAPMPPMGSLPPNRPPPSIVVSGAAVRIGTFMVYRGRKLVLSMAASDLGQEVIGQGAAMLVGAVMKRLAPGTTIRFHTGKSAGDPPRVGARRASAVSYEDAWRAVPQEFSYWEK